MAHDRNIYRQLITTVGDITVWRVNGNYIRTHLDTEFPNFGQHYRHSFIPENEFWIDREITPRNEAPFYIAHLIKEHELMSKGVPYERALDLANKVEKFERNKFVESATTKQYRRGIESSSLFHKKLLGTRIVSGEKVFIWEVDSEKIRTHLYMDWVEGGHGYVYKWIPVNEVWIDDNLSKREVPFVLLHEMHERNLMKNKGMNYNDAHAKACRVELAFRIRSLKKKSLTNVI